MPDTVKKGDEIAALSTLAPGEKPTLKTIARLSGLAVPTISRALNDAPDIGQATKDKVRRIAAEIGYVPNRAGVRLRTGRTNVISLVLSTEHDMMNHTARLISSIAGGFRATPFHMIMTPFFPDEDPLKPIKYVVETGSADAVIFNQIKDHDPRVDYLLNKGFPFATHGRTLRAAEHAYYDFDNFAFARIAIERLVERGRRNILLIHAPAEHAYGRHMIDGAVTAAKDNGIQLVLSDAVTSDSLSTEVRAAVTRHLNEDPTIDGMVIGSTSATMAAVSALEEWGAKVPEDIDIHSKEAIPFLSYFRPGILTLTEDVGAAGEFLARAAMRAVQSPHEPPMQELEVPGRSAL